MIFSRRKMLKNSGLAIGAAFWSGLPTAGAKSVAKPKHNFKYCLNTSTIRKQNLGLMQEIEIAAKAGYDGIEIWISTLEEFVNKGGNPSDVAKKAKDLGITIENSIGFAKWIADDDAVRNEAFEQAKQEMDLLAKTGCFRMAAPPIGETKTPGLDLNRAAERYNRLLKLGDETGVLPQLELWGFSANLHLVGEVLYVAAESGHPKACVLPDVYHIHKGGSDFNSLKLINGSSMRMLHMNDFPAEPSREKIADKDRVYPGDGVAPMDQILKDVNEKGSPIVLSLELFNEDYWKQDALLVARTGLDKMKQSVQKALS